MRRICKAQQRRDQVNCKNESTHVFTKRNFVNIRKELKRRINNSYFYGVTKHLFSSPLHPNNSVKDL